MCLYDFIVLLLCLFSHVSIVLRRLVSLEESRCLGKLIAKLSTVAYAEKDIDLKSILERTFCCSSRIKIMIVLNAQISLVGVKYFHLLKKCKCKSHVNTGKVILYSKRLRNILFGTANDFKKRLNSLRKKKNMEREK